VAFVVAGHAPAAGDPRERSFDGQPSGDHRESPSGLEVCAQSLSWFSVENEFSREGAGGLAVSEHVPHPTSCLRLPRPQLKPMVSRVLILQRFTA
jgi:hypothetical protein